MASGAALAAREVVLEAPTGRDFWVHDFGAVGNGVADDGPAVRAAIARASGLSSGARVRFRPGTYRLGPPPEGSYALAVARARGLTIEGHEATLVVADPSLGCLRFDRCQGCTVRGLTIDYDPLPHALGQVLDVRPEEDVVDVEFTPELPMPDEPFFTFAEPGIAHPTSFGVVFAAATRMLKPSTPDHVMVEAARRVRGNSFRLRTRRNAIPRPLAPGDLFVYPVRQYGNAFGFFDSPDAVVDDVRVMAANAAGIALIRSDRARIRHTTIAPTNSQQLLSTNGDGVHAQDCRVGPVIEHCTFEGMLDDGLNVYGQPFVVTEVTGDSALVLSGRGELRQDDVLQFFEPARGSTTGIRRVVRADEAPDGGSWRVRIDRPVNRGESGGSPLPPHTVFNLSACGSGVLVSDTAYRRHRGISARIRAQHGVIESSTFSQSGSSAIVLSNDPDWPEGPPPARVRVAGNRIESPNAVTGAVAVDIGARALGGAVAADALVSDISVEGNTIDRWRGVGVFVGGARDVSLRDIEFRAGGEAELPTAAVRIDKASSVAVDQVNVTGRVAAAISIGPAVHRGEGTVRVGEVRADAGSPVLRDER